MTEKFTIIIGGIVAALIAVGVVELIYGVTATLTAGRLITLVVAMLSTGILYALTYAMTGAKKGDLAGMTGGIFAGAIGGILSWAIGEAIFGPFAVTGLVIVALVGGFLFSAQIDPEQV